MVEETSRLGKAIVLTSGAVEVTKQDDRETIKRLLAFPPDTNIVWKSHDDSIAQRSALDDARQQKTGPGNKERRQTIHEDQERGSGKLGS
jgi:hypothetical protein